MKSLVSLIIERLKLNKDTKISIHKTDGMTYHEWTKQIIKNYFNINVHALSNSYDTIIIKEFMGIENHPTQNLRFIHLDPIPKYLEDICEDILNDSKKYKDKLVFQDSFWHDNINFYYQYVNDQHIILIINFRDLYEGQKKYHAYEVYENIE